MNITEALKNDVVMFNFLANNDYYDILSLCSTDKRINKICQDKMLWIEKAKQEFNVDIDGNSVKEVRDKYFELYDFVADDIEDIDYTDLLIRIIERCKRLEKISNKDPRIYFFGRRMGNIEDDLQVGLIARNPLVAHALLRLMAVCYGESLDSVFGQELEWFEGKDVSLTDIISKLAHIAKEYGSDFKLTDVFETESYFRHKMRKYVNTIDNIDLWNMQKIETYLLWCAAQHD